MNHHKLGNTDLKIAPIGLGVGGVLGEKFFYEPKALHLIQTALDNGINFLDTGSSYSHGNAELRLGKVLSKNELDKLVIATKGGTVLTPKNKLARNFSKESLLKNVDISLQKLGVDRIDLFQLHSPSLKDINDDVLDTLHELKIRGKINYIGISCDGPVLDKAIEIALFDTVMLTYNVLCQNVENQITEAKKRGKGILIKSPMAHSLYGNDIFKITTVADIWYLLRVLKNYRPEIVEGLKYRFINNIKDWTGAEIALKFVLENPHIDCALIGTTRVNHLLANIRVITRDLDQLILTKIKTIGNPLAVRAN